MYTFTLVHNYFVYGLITESQSLCKMDKKMHNFGSVLYFITFGNMILSGAYLGLGVSKLIK